MTLGDGKRPRISNRRGQVRWDTIVRQPGSEPFLRYCRAGNVIVLTPPNKYALTIEPDGRVSVRSLHSLTWTGSKRITPAQHESLKALGVAIPEGWEVMALQAGWKADLELTDYRHLALHEQGGTS